MKKLVILFALLLAPTLALTACNTIQGVGADIQAGGAAMDRAINR